MKAALITRYGGSDALHLADLPDPSPQAGEAVVAVRVAGLNFAETLMRVGGYAINPDLPAVLGSEVSGVVETVGPDVDASWIGRRVAAPIFASGRLTGGYAEKVVLPASLLVTLPDNLSFEDAAALQVQGLTAAYLLKQVDVGGRSVLVQAAAGGVGSLLVQLATQAGARKVIAAASTAKKRSLAVSLGADAAIDYTREDWPDAVRAETDGAGIDVIFDAGAGSPAASLDALAPGGELVIYGSLSLGSFALSGPELGPLIFKNATIRGFALPTLLTPEGLHAELPKLFDAAARGDLRVVQGGSYPLGRAGEAHRALESRASTGKLVLVPEVRS